MPAGPLGASGVWVGCCGVDLAWDPHLGPRGALTCPACGHYVPFEVLLAHGSALLRQRLGYNRPPADTRPSPINMGDAVRELGHGVWIEGEPRTGAILHGPRPVLLAIARELGLGRGARARVYAHRALATLWLDPRVAVRAEAAHARVHATGAAAVDPGIAGAKEGP